MQSHQHRSPGTRARQKRRVCCCALAFSVALVVIAACFVGHPVWHVLHAWYIDPPARPAGVAGTVNDASRLNRTTVSQVLAVEKDPAAAEEQLRQLLARATRENLQVSVAGARHSMGGHTIYPGGVAINMLPFNRMSMDRTTDILHVGAGAKWNQILPYLNKHGKSVAVMQSNNSFSVGGSISVNCHGWQTGKPPIASTVDSFRLMLGDGRIVRCSRAENSELFSLALGGYGLFGIILDVDLRVAPNEQLKLTRLVMDIKDYPSAQRMSTEPGSGAVLTYGRLDVSAAHPMGSALLNVWKRVPGTAGTTSSIHDLPMRQLRRAIFRGSVGNDYGKDLRWWAESDLSPWISSGIATRNELLSVGVELFENRSPNSTDILHEYFIPVAHFASFVEAAHKIISRDGADLLNVTVRDVMPDHDTFLRYADQRMLCLVMLFNQAMTEEGEQKMESLTQQLIDAALQEDGSYYLTYRLHATQQQIRQAYPNLDAFFEKKREYDPAEIFQNKFYQKYAKRVLPE